MRYIQTYDHEFNVLMLVEQDGYTKAAASAQVTMSELLQAVGTRKCKTDGHLWVDESYGFAESGAIHIHCTRCGFFNKTTLY